MHLGFEDTKTIAPVNTTGLTGLMSGTTVMTLDGEIPVEHLTIGDRVITRDSGMAVLLSIETKTADIAPILIKAGSLGHTRPDRDMILSPEALVHIRDWRAEALFGKAEITVPARRLIDGEFVSEGAKRRVKLHELVFDRPHIIYADGLEVATTPH